MPSRRPLLAGLGSGAGAGLAGTVRALSETEGGMHPEGHAGAALLAYAPVAGLLAAAGAADLLLAGGVVAVGLASLPDVDVRLPGIAHRGPTHTVWFAAVVGVAAAAVGGLVSAGGAVLGGPRGPVAGLGMAVLGFYVGTATVLSHVAADAITPMGVRPFAPVSDRHYTFDLVRARNRVANYLLLAGGGGVAVGATWLGTRLGALV